MTDDTNDPFENARDKELADNLYTIVKIFAGVVFGSLVIGCVFELGRMIAHAWFG